MKIAPFGTLRMSSYWRSIATMSSYWRSIATMALSAVISKMKTRQWSKIVIFHTPLHSMPPIGRRPPSEYCHNFWYEKAPVLDSEKVSWYDQLFQQNAGVWQTDGQTDILREDRSLWSLRPDNIETVEDRFGLYVHMTSRLSRTAVKDRFGLYVQTTSRLSRTALVFTSGRHRDCRGLLWSVCWDNIETVEDQFGLYVTVK